MDRFSAARTQGLLVLLWIACGSLAGGEETAAARLFPTRVRGITVSTHRAGQEWGTAATMRPTLEQLHELGAGWVAIHPYAGIAADGSLRYKPINPAEPPAYLAEPIRLAHALGLKILIKPHLAYWGSPFTWRGEIDFDEAAEWENFWHDYRTWIVALAAATRDADGFVVGTELERTVSQRARWLELIKDVRKRTRAPLTYASNWDSYRTVPFWNALDAIGIQGYFPLVGADDAITEESVKAGWQRRSLELREYSQAMGRPILLTELGYNHSATTAREPWSSTTDETGESIQLLCTRVALEAIESEPLILGAFLWKWFPEPHPVGRNFRLATPQMRAVIRDAWKAATP